MATSRNIKDRHLERQGRALGRPGWRLIGLSALLAIPGAVLVAIDSGWSLGFGIALLAIGGGPAIVGIALLGASAIARWAARHRLFA
jgi:hypothetical protein